MFEETASPREKTAEAPEEVAAMAPVAPYMSPDYFSPKEISAMTAGFAAAFLASGLARTPQMTSDEAMVYAVRVVATAIDDDRMGELFAKITKVCGFRLNGLEESRRRLREDRETQERLANEAAAAAGG